MDEATLLREIGVRIREHRLAKKLSQEQLAFEAEVDRSFLSQVETGDQNVSMGKLLQVAQALDVAVSALIPTGK